MTNKTKEKKIIDEFYRTQYKDAEYRKGRLQALNEVQEMIDNVYYKPCFDRKRTEDFNLFCQLINKEIERLKNGK
jgi:hypothetical protein